MSAESSQSPNYFGVFLPVLGLFVLCWWMLN